MNDPESANAEKRARRSRTLGLFSWALYDWANSPFPTLIQTFLFAAYFTRRVAENETSGTAQWGIMMGAAGIAVAIGAPFLGAIADQTGARKRWIGVFTALCVLASALLWFVKPSPSFIWLALPLVWLGSVGVEYASLFYNSMLGAITSPERIGRWSGWGWALGYAGGLAALLIALFGFVKPEDSWLPLDRDAAEHVRITFLLVGVWFAVFSLPLFLFTPDTAPTGKKFRAAAVAGVRQLWDSIRHVRRYATIIRFLIARMIYVEGLATMFAFGGVYAAGTFKMTEEQVMMFGIALNVTAGLGAFGLAWVDDWIGPKRTILVSLVGLIIPGSLMLLATNPTWFWIFGAALGLFVGPVQAASRSFLSHASPPELRNQMFGLFAFSGKATSFLGPLLVGWLTYWSGSQRVGMTAIMLLFAIGFALMCTVPPVETKTQEPESVPSKVDLP